MAAVEKFGQYLLRNQVISQEQLNEALQCQVIFGGRLGTNLVELGYLTLDDLARLLSRRSGYPAASPEELEELPREVLSSLPKPTIEKYKIIPIRTEAKSLHLAVCDPTDVKTMDEIQFATGMRIKPYLLPELRMFYLLEKHYGLKRDIRYIRLGRSLSRGKYAGAMVGTPATTTPGGVPTIVEPFLGPGNGKTMPAPDTAELELKGFRKLKEGEELTEEVPPEKMQFSSGTLAEQANTATAKIRAGVAPNAELIGLTPPAAMAASAPPPLVVGTTDDVGPMVTLSPFSKSREDEETLNLPVGVLPLLDETHLEPIEPIEELPLAALVAAEVPFPPPLDDAETTALQKTLRSAHDRDEAAAAAIRLARTHCGAVALFIVNKGMLSGWKAAGGALDRQGIESVMLPSDAESILKSPAAGKTFQGAVPKGGLNDRLLAALGRVQPVHALVIPIALKNRVVNLLYTDNGHAPIEAAQAAYLESVAKDMSAAYERIILAKKKSAN